MLSKERVFQQAVSNLSIGQRLYNFPQTALDFTQSSFVYSCTALRLFVRYMCMDSGLSYEKCEEMTFRESVEFVKEHCNVSSEFLTSLETREDEISLCADYVSSNYKHRVPYELITDTLKLAESALSETKCR